MKETEKKVIELRRQISKLNDELEKLLVESDNSLSNKLKGDQFTAFLGEYYASKIIGGKIEVNENSNYDLIQMDGTKVEVKTRAINHNKSGSTSYFESSTISLNKDGNDPQLLCFVLINKDDFSLNTVWVYDIEMLIRENRIKKNNKKTFLRVSKKKDFENMVYPYAKIDGVWNYIGSESSRDIYPIKEVEKRR